MILSIIITVIIIITIIIIFVALVITITKIPRSWLATLPINGIPLKNGKVLN